MTWWQGDGMNNPIIRFKSLNGVTFPDWKEFSFQEIFEFKSSAPLSRSQLNYLNGEVKNIHYGDILLKLPPVISTDSELLPYINQDCIPDKYEALEKGDIIFADTAEDYSLGKAIEIISTPLRVTSGLHTIACKAKLEFASGFLAYCLNSNYYQDQINRLATGTKVYSIIKSNIIKTKLRAPSSYEEQQKISSFFSALDQKIELNEQKLEALEELKKGLMQKIFNRKIRFKKDDGTDFPDTVSCTLRDISEYSKCIVEKKNSLFIGNEQLISNFGGTTLNFRRVAKGNAFNSGDILFGNIRPYLKKVWLSNESGIASPDVLIFKATNAIPGYLKCILSSERFFNHVAQGYKGSKMPRGDKQQIMNFSIQCPCLEEQQKIADFLSALDLKIDIKRKTVAAMRDLKRGFMQQMFV